jgi:hypothetical protein
MSLADQLANAIARVESGNFDPNSIAMKNNNPGNLRSWGNYPVVNGFVQFPDYATGMQALQTQAQKNIDRGLTLTEFFAGKPGVYGGYAPAADNNQPGSYAQTVASWLGISTDQQLNQVGDSAAATAASDGSVNFDVPDILSGGGDSGVSPTVVAAAVIGGAALLWIAFA